MEPTPDPIRDTRPASWRRSMMSLAQVFRHTYLDARAASLLEEGREAFRSLGLDEQSLVADEGSTLAVFGKAVAKYDHLLTPELLTLEHASRTFDVPGAVQALEALLAA
jgi:hypothetical protein